MNNLLQRAITGSIFVSLIIGGLWIGTETSITVISLFLILGIIEYFKLFKENKTIAINLPLAVLFNIIVFGLIVAATTGIIPGQFIFIIFPLTFLPLLQLRQLFHLQDT